MERRVAAVSPKQHVRAMGSTLVCVNFGWTCEHGGFERLGRHMEQGSVPPLRFSALTPRRQNAHLVHASISIYVQHALQQVIVRARYGERGKLDRLCRVFLHVPPESVKRSKHPQRPQTRAGEPAPRRPCADSPKGDPDYIV